MSWNVGMSKGNLMSQVDDLLNLGCKVIDQLPQTKEPFQSLRDDLSPLVQWQLIETTKSKHLRSLCGDWTIYKDEVKGNYTLHRYGVIQGVFKTSAEARQHTSKPLPRRRLR